MNEEEKSKEDIIKLAEEKIDEVESKREANKIVKDLKIITAISLGKDRNKELAKVLDTDKSFAAKKVKDLEQRGLVHKEGEGKQTRYRVDIFNVMKFLQSRVIIKTRKKIKPKEEIVTNAQTEEKSKEEEVKNGEENGRGNEAV